MSTSSAPPASRSTWLAAAGAVVLVATYTYLILTRPTGTADDATTHAGLIALAGYLIGALLLAAGSLHRLSTTTVVLIPLAIALNIVVGQIVALLQLPLYLDSLGTVLVAALAGPAAGIVAGILTNIVWGLTLSPAALPFAVVQVVIGLLAGVAARTGLFRSWWRAALAGLVTGLVTAVVSAPIAAFVYGGVTSGGTGALVGAFQAMGQSLLEATTLQGLVSDPIDKAVTFALVALMLRGLPPRILNRFPFARDHRVFGGAPSARQP